MSAPLSWWRNSTINRRAWTWEDANQTQHWGEWWQNAVIYQINVLSFMDSDGDGLGDLNGVIQQLDYIASLGVDAIWLCPFYESPLRDFGYDVTNLKTVDPRFGSLNDFDHLLQLAHMLGLKVILDAVWNHTSNRHPWFQESRQDRQNPKADWYVWADPQPDGSPPNNWLSALTGDSAWTWSPERQQFYFHNFLASQPDLNWHNPQVVEAILERAEFWLDRGVDGLRLDAANYLLHDPELRDNPPRPPEADDPDGIDLNHPLARQILQYSFSRPAILERLTQIRKLVDRYPGTMLLGEVTLCEDSIALAGEYVQGDERLHLAYHAGLLVDEPMSAALMKSVLARVQQHFPTGGTCWIVGNHDYGRLRSQWQANQNHYPDDFYRLMAALLLALPGAFCLYQGDELGLTVAAIPDDIPEQRIDDPLGQALYPEVPGRDGSRTPMPWQADAPLAGFTTAERAWLPLPAKHRDRTVNRQHHQPESLLNTWRRALRWRERQPALVAGDFELLATDDPIVAFVREYAEQKLLCAFNLSTTTAVYELGENATCRAIADLGFEFEQVGDRLHLPGYAAFFANLSCN